MKLKLAQLLRTPNKSFFQLMILCHILLLVQASCVNKIDDDDELPPNLAHSNSNLTIITRTGAADEKISYPVHLYLFDGMDKCVGRQTMSDASSNTISFKLTAGTYTILAFAGATEDNYNLPDAKTATRTTAISLKAGKNHTDLMTASSTTTLAENEDNTTTLALKRKVMLIKNAVVNDLPDGLSTVSLQVQPLYESILLNGEYGAGTSGLYTLQLEKQADGSWSAPTENYLLPGNANATITIKTVDTGNAVKSYSFSSETKMETNYQFNIEGTYKAETGIVLTGTVSGDSWAGTKNITFNFDADGSSSESGGTTGGGNNPGGGDATDGIPLAGSSYRGCYVLSVTNVSATSATLTLLAPAEVTGVNKDEAMAIENAIAQCSVAGISGWRLPDETEAKIIFKNYADSQKGNNVLTSLGGNVISKQNYYCSTGNVPAQTVSVFKVGEASFSKDEWSSSAAVRAVTSLEVTAEK